MSVWYCDILAYRSCVWELRFVLYTEQNYRQMEKTSKFASKAEKDLRDNTKEGKNKGG